MADNKRNINISLPAFRNLRGYAFDPMVSLDLDTSGHLIPDEDGVDPEHEALMADAIGPALLVVLDTLSPPERLAFVLHDLFGVPYDEIAPIVGRTPATARQLGKTVTVLEAADRLMGRVVAPEISAHFLALHRGWGADIRLLTPVGRIVGESGRVVAVETAGGDRIPVLLGDFADVAVAGRYPLIFLVFNTLSNLVTQERQVQCFQNVAAHLDEDGAFVVEAIVPSFLHRLRDDQYVDAEAIGLDSVRLDVLRHDPVTQLLHESHVSLSRDRVRAKQHGLQYCEVFHYVSRDENPVDDYISRNAVSL